MSLNRVRIRRDVAANRDAASRDALAFTAGKDIAFARHAPPLATPEGRWLLAHEVAHIAQQDAQPPRVRLQPDPFGRFDPNRAVSDVPGAIPTDLMDPLSGVDVDEKVRITAPLLAGQLPGPDDDEQIYHLHSSILSKIPISAFAVPRERLTLDAEGNTPAKSTATVQPDVPPGSIVYGPDHRPHAVLAADAANVIVESSVTIHFAVGAGSCVLVHTNGGWYLFDAGINLTEPHSLARGVADKIVAQLNGEPIRAVFLTHAHYDHTKLLEWIARRVQIEAIVANPRQITRQEFLKIKEGVRANDLERRNEKRDQLERDPAAREAFIESLHRDVPNDAIDPRDVERAWKDEVAHRIAEQFPEIKEIAALPVAGRGGTHFETTGTSPSRTSQADPALQTALEDVLPSAEEGVDFRGVVDPSVRANRRRKKMKPHEVDRMSTTYILTIDGRRLLVLPDLRRPDIARIKDQLREILQVRDVEFQEWVAGHHMGTGFLKARVVSVKTLRQTLELLDSFRAKGAAGRAGRDVVIASVDASKVDAVQIRLLRALGFETYLAQSEADVRTYSIYSRGKLIRAVRGPLAPGAPGEPTIQRSIAARRQLQDQKVRLEQQKRATRKRAERAEIAKQMKAVDERVKKVRDLEDALIHKLRQKELDQAAADQAEAALNRELDAQGVGRIVTSTSQLTDTALVLLREPLGPEPPPGTPEAEQRALDRALREQKARVDVFRETARAAEGGARQDAYADYYVELVEYEHRLEEAAKTAKGVPRELVEAEFEHTGRERKALEHSFRTSESVRLPDGQVVQNKLVRVAAPEAQAGWQPSPAARTIMQGLDIVGRGMGALMVVSTIRGTPELIAQYEKGNVNLAQFVMGGTRQIASGYVGLRMLRGQKVGSSVFIVMSVWEIGEALAGDYESGAQRTRAVSAAVRNAAINTGCLVVGDMLVSSGHPVAMVVGAVIMFLGPTLINFLFGDDTPETLFPSEVGAVDETLVKLLGEYYVVVGGLVVQGRDPAARADIGLTADLSHEADESILKHRMRALTLERDIIFQFEVAYKKAKEGRAGLRELDEMRQQFLYWRSQASTDASDEEAREALHREFMQHAPEVGLTETSSPWLPQHDASGQPIPIREQTLRRLEAVEGKLSLQTHTAEQIRKMDQWTSIRTYVEQLARDVLTESDPDWRDIAQRQHDLEARLASARYRLAPDTQGKARHTPLLESGSVAYTAYAEELSRAEKLVSWVEEVIMRAHWQKLPGFRHLAFGQIDALGQPAANFPSAIGRALLVVDDALDVYQQAIREAGTAPAAVGGVVALYGEPAARLRYRAEIENNGSYRKLIQRLEINQMAVLSFMQTLRRQLTPSAVVPPPGAISPQKASTRLDALEERFQRLQNDRKVERGLLYLQEVDEIDAKERSRAIAFFAPKLGAREDEKPLTPQEIAAFKTGEYGVAGAKVLTEKRSIIDRLKMVSGLRAPTGPTEFVDAAGTPIRISRRLEGIMVLDGLTAPDTRLVGVVEEKVSAGNQLVSVVPLNDAAVTALGGYAPQWVFGVRLTEATEAELER